MPQIRVAKANDQIEQEQSKEKTFDEQEVFAFCLPFLTQFLALIECKRCAEKHNQTKDDGDVRPCVWHVTGAANPCQITEQDQAQGAAERIALIRQPGQGKTNQRIDRESEDEDKDIPDDQSRY